MTARFQPQRNDTLRQAVKNYYVYNDRSHGPIGTWDTSLITDMSMLFYHYREFNESISDWNTSSVTDMRGMFEGCKSFNQPLHMWDTSSVKNMSCMFTGCTSFHQPLGNWHAERVLFQHCPDPDYCCTAVHDHYCVK